jgi:hypothetical protein
MKINVYTILAALLFLIAIVAVIKTGAGALVLFVAAGLTAYLGVLRSKNAPSTNKRRR